MASLGFVRVIIFFIVAQILALADSLVKAQVAQNSTISVLTPLNPKYYFRQPLAFLSVILGFMQFVFILRAYEESESFSQGRSIAGTAFAAFLFVFSIFIIINYIAYFALRSEFLDKKGWLLVVGIIIFQVLSAILAYLLGITISQSE